VHARTHARIRLVRACCKLVERTDTRRHLGATVFEPINPECLITKLVSLIEISCFSKHLFASRATRSFYLKISDTSGRYLGVTDEILYVLRFLLLPFLLHPGCGRLSRCPESRTSRCKNYPQAKHRCGLANFSVAVRCPI